MIAISSFTDNHYVFEVSLKRENISSYAQYPFSIPAIASLHDLELHPKVTFFIGENGAGKSTLVEAVAIAYGFNPEGGSKHFNFSTCESHADLYRYIVLRKGVARPRDAYFLRSESFYNVATTVDSLGLDDAYGNRSLHAQSHGESFMSLFLHRFLGKGFYILDEPEAALSPMRQLALISRLHELVADGSQFIIATHSPLLLAYPNACIYQLDDNGIHRIQYEQTDHFMISKSFMNNYQGMLKELMRLS